MKKILLTIGLILFTILFSFSQQKEKKVKWTDKVNSEIGFDIAEFIGSDETGYYFNKISHELSGKDSYQIERYDNNLKIVKDRDVFTGKGKKRKKIVSILHLNNKLQLLTSFKDSKTKIHTLILQSIDKKTLETKSETKKLAEFSFNKYKKKYVSKFFLRISKDTTKIMAFYYVPVKQKEKEKIGFVIFDSNFNKIWSKEVTLPYLHKLIEIIDYTVDNKGNVHFVARIFNKKRKGIVKGKVNFKLQILSFYQNDTNIKKYDIVQKDRIINDINIIVNKHNEIICTGFTYDRIVAGIKGTYFLKIDQNNKKIVNENYQEFNDRIISEYLSAAGKKKVKRRSAKNKSALPLFYKFHDVINKTDGSVVIVAEYYMLNSTPNMNYKTGSTKPYFIHDRVFGNILVIKLSPEGNIIWAKKVPKTQLSTSDGTISESFAKLNEDREMQHTSFTTITLNNKIHLIYNDNPKNLVLDNNKRGRIFKLNNAKKSVVVMATIDDTGKLTRKVISKPTKMYIAPRMTKQFYYKKFILVAVDDNYNYRFARVDLQD